MALGLLAFVVMLPVARGLMVAIYQSGDVGMAQVLGSMLLAAVSGLSAQAGWNLRVSLRPLQARDLREIERLAVAMVPGPVPQAVRRWREEGVFLRRRDLLAVSHAYHREHGGMVAPPGQ